MPYIKKEDREPFVPLLNDLALVVARRGLSNGELNWLLTKVALQYLLAHGITYDTLSDVIKAFECAKLEFARRMIAPYEDAKRAQNGDVYMETYADYGEVAELILDMDPIFFSTHWFVADLFWSDTQEGKQFLKDLSNEENQ